MTEKLKKTAALPTKKILLKKIFFLLYNFFDFFFSNFGSNSLTDNALLSFNLLLPLSLSFIHFSLLLSFTHSLSLSLSLSLLLASIKGNFFSTDETLIIGSLSEKSESFFVSSDQSDHPMADPKKSGFPLKRIVRETFSRLSLECCSIDQPLVP